MNIELKIEKGDTFLASVARGETIYKGWAVGMDEKGYIHPFSEQDSINAVFAGFASHISSGGCQIEVFHRANLRLDITGWTRYDNGRKFVYAKTHSVFGVTDRPQDHEGAIVGKLSVDGVVKMDV